MIHNVEASIIAEFPGVETKGVFIHSTQSSETWHVGKEESFAVFQQMLEDGFWSVHERWVEFEKMLFQL